MEGNIHSLESFGTVDGPGVRFVVFFQGCPFRCLYCHNPDTWDPGGGMKMSVQDIIDRIERNRGFYRNGGLTATGGEPLLQIDFLTELFTAAKEAGIHTCLDTSGSVFRKEDPLKLEKFERLMQVTDLVLLDIKHMDETEHRKLTGSPSQAVFAFADFLMEHQIPVWIRHVVVPGITDKQEELTALGRFLAGLTNFEKLEILKYHTMATLKYEAMNLEYPLKGVPQLTKEEAQRAEAIVLEAMEQRKQELNEGMTGGITGDA